MYSAIIMFFGAHSNMERVTQKVGEPGHSVDHEDDEIDDISYILKQTNGKNILKCTLYSPVILMRTSKSVND